MKDFIPHKSHDMTDWRSTTITLVETSRFGEIRKCNECRAEHAKTVCGEAHHDELESECEAETMSHREERMKKRTQRNREVASPPKNRIEKLERAFNVASSAANREMSDIDMDRIEVHEEINAGSAGLNRDDNIGVALGRMQDMIAFAREAEEFLISCQKILKEYRLLKKIEEMKKSAECLKSAEAELAKLMKTGAYYGD